MTSYVLDSSAVIALLSLEPGADVAARYLPDACISSVNYAEVITKFCERGVSVGEAQAAFAITGVEVISFDAAQALLVGALRMETRAAGLSLGDRTCLALARSLGVPAVTSDRAWARVQGHNVLLIR